MTGEVAQHHLVFIGDRPGIDFRQAEELRGLRGNLFLAALLAAPVVILETGGHLVPAFHHWTIHTLGPERARLISFVFATLTLLGPGREFYRAGIPTLLRFRPDLNALVAVGTLSAYLYSVVATFPLRLLPTGAEHVDYEAAVVIVALILLGRLLKARAKGRTSEAIRALTRLQPRVAHVSHPLRAATAQGGELGRPGARAEVHAVGRQRRRRTLAV